MIVLARKYASVILSIPSSRHATTAHGLCRHCCLVPQENAYIFRCYYINTPYSVHNNIIELMQVIICICMVKVATWIFQLSHPDLACLKKTAASL